ncbi:MAG: hypothetical protein ACTSVM_02435 [Candidatus Ranarchaeia archaeon]
MTAFKQQCLKLHKNMGPSAGEHLDWSGIGRFNCEDRGRKSLASERWGNTSLAVRFIGDIMAGAYFSD